MPDGCFDSLQVFFAKMVISGFWHTQEFITFVKVLSTIYLVISDYQGFMEKYEKGEI